jgi:hypothetical protein
MATLLDPEVLVASAQAPIATLHALAAAEPIALPEAKPTKVFKFEPGQQALVPEKVPIATLKQSVVLYVSVQPPKVVLHAPDSMLHCENSPTAVFCAPEPT